MSRNPLLVAVTAAVTLALGGCSLLAPRPPAVVAPPAPVEPPKPVYAAPVATHRFEIDPEHDDVVGRLQVTVAEKEDTLPDIARRFNVGYEDIVRANPGVDPWLPGAGREIVVPTQYVLPNAPREGVVINLAAMRIYYFPDKVENGKKVARKPGEKLVVYTHPIGIGKVGWKTPEGTTKVVGKQKDPTWRPSAAVRREHAENGDPIPAVVGPGPDNPLGKFKFNLGWPSYLIHGTNKPYGVGLRSSHGCIRLYPEDIESFFKMIPNGTKVTVVNQPYVFGWHDEQLYLQAYGVLEDDKRDWKKSQQKLLTKTLTARIQKELKDRGEQVDWERVQTIAQDPRGIAVSASRVDVSFDGVVAAALRVENRIPDGSNWDGADDPARQAQADVEGMATEQAVQSKKTSVPAAPAGKVAPQPRS
jgi:L,D-transpeptidase ErfK/SrfK